MLNKNLLIAYCTTFLAFSTLYAPQPILPLLSEQFGVSAADSTLLVTITLIPLALAPVFYGYFLQAIPARTMLQVAISLLIINQLAFFAATQFWHLLALRFVQGLLMPAIFTSLMTYCATMSPPHRVRKTMGIYIGVTILGGFLSRAISGVLAETLGWQWVFVALGVLLIVPLIMLRHIDADAEINFQRLDVKTIGRVLKNPLFRLCYLVLFGVFFVFASILNLLPFRLTEIDPTIGPLEISLIYTGYLIGIPIAFMSDKLIQRFGSIKRALLIGLGINLVGLMTYTLPSVMMLFAMMFVFAAGMFFIHATLSGLVNDLATEHKGVVNGLYVSIYYLSGALGSWLPGYIYFGFGWQNLVIMLVILLGGVAYLTSKISV